MGDATCCCSTEPAACPYHGRYPAVHDTYAEHCRLRVPGTPAHDGARCALCDLLDHYGVARDDRKFTRFQAEVLADPVTRSAYAAAQDIPASLTDDPFNPDYPWTPWQRLRRAYYGHPWVRAVRRRTHTDARLVWRMTRTVYWEPRDVWVGYYRGDDHHYVCPIPCLVIRWGRVPKEAVHGD